MSEVEAMDQQEQVEDESTIENQDVDVSRETSDAETQDTDDGTVEDSEEIEIVREVQGSQPKPAKQSGFQKRINQLNAKKKEAQEETSKVNSELEAERERNKILEMALKATGDTPAPVEKPDPANFDGGLYDEAYEKKKEEFDALKLQSEILKAQQAYGQQQAIRHDEETKQAALVKQQEAHYEKAETLKAKDYNKREDRTIEILGETVFNQVISNFEGSHLLAYYMGTEANKDEAFRMRDLLKSNPVKGVRALAQLETELKIKPKNTVAPEPDLELQGSSGGSGGGKFNPLKGVKLE